MEVIYTIHNNFDHCYADFLGKKMGYFQLKDLLKERGKKYITNNKVKPKSYSVEINYDSIDFKKSNLSDEEIEEYLISKKKAKAKSWLSSQRNLRKRGKLSSNHIKMLNELGMLWNPKEDEWEKNFSLFQKKEFVDILKGMRKKEIWVSEKKLDRVIETENWVNEQRRLHLNNKLNKENLIRLEAINFPFKLAEDEKKDLKLSSLAKIVFRISELRRHLSIYGNKDFAKRFSIKEKTYVGTPIKITETLVQKTHNKEWEEYEKMSKRDDKYLVKAEKEHKLAEENAIKILKTKPTEYFFKEIDKLAKKRGSNLWSSFTRHNVNYGYIGGYLNNSFHFPRTTINNVVFEAAYGKFNYNNDVKIYAAKKMLEILDKHLLKTGNLNHRKTFKPISYLLRYFQKEKNIQELVDLKEFIENHQILSLIYLDRINKIIQKCTKN